eukprot:COSAG02_NODE_5782_length_4038_cov_2.503427_4_plen_116_part_00
MDTSAGTHRMFGFYKTCTIGMPSLRAGMPLTTTQYALNIKRQETLQSVTHRAYGPYALCVTPYPGHTSRRDNRLRHAEFGEMILDESMLDFPMAWVVVKPNGVRLRGPWPSATTP